MIRLATAVWLALAAVIVFGLFQLKHEMQALEDETFRVNRQIVAEQEAIHVLRAEWSYINQPQRLQSLAARYLDLQPIRPNQIVHSPDFGLRAPDLPAAAPTIAPRQATPIDAPRPVIRDGRAADFDSRLATGAPAAAAISSRVLGNR